MGHKDPYVGLLGKSAEYECLRGSRVMRIQAVLYDAFGKLYTKYEIGPGYSYAISNLRVTSVISLE